MDATMTLVPPTRVGALLARHRVQQGVDLRALQASAAARGINLHAEDLRLIELGRTVMSDDQFGSIMELYGVEPGQLLAERSRLILDIHAGVIRAGRHETELGRRRDEQCVYLRYVSLLYMMRNAKPGSRLQLRRDDLDVLSETFGRPPGDIATDLRQLMTAQRTAALTRRLHHHFRVPQAGLLVGLTAIGSLIIAPPLVPTQAPVDPAEVAAMISERQDPEAQVSSSSLERPSDADVSAMQITRPARDAQHPS